MDLRYYFIFTQHRQCYIVEHVTWTNVDNEITEQTANAHDTLKHRKRTSHPKDAYHTGSPSQHFRPGSHLDQPIKIRPRLADVSASESKKLYTALGDTIGASINLCSRREVIFVLMTSTGAQAGCSRAGTDGGGVKRGVEARERSGTAGCP